MTTNSKSMSNNTGASKSSQENGRVGGNITKDAIERAKQTTDTEALKQEVANIVKSTGRALAIGYANEISQYL